MNTSDDIHRRVVLRAGNRCEYCLLPQEGQAWRFPIDHVVPRSRGGGEELANLALSCFGCNSFKWAFTESDDPATGTSVPLFNPRTQVWSEHFQWSSQDPSIVVGKTPTGRATVIRLQMNHPDLLAARRILARQGHHPHA